MRGNAGEVHPQTEFDAMGSAALHTDTVKWHNVHQQC